MASPEYGLGGTCGWQHNNTVCTPQAQRSCCSENGCFTRYGCQSSCVDPPAFYLTTSSTPTSTAVTATASPTPMPALTSGQKTGIIAGATLLALIVVFVIGLLVWRRTRPTATFTRRHPNGTVDTLTMQQNISKQLPQIIANQNNLIRDSHRPTVGGLPWRGASSTDGQYLGDPDDHRFEDLTSEP